MAAIAGIEAVALRVAGVAAPTAAGADGIKDCDAPDRGVNAAAVGSTAPDKAGPSTGATGAEIVSTGATPRV